VELLIEATLQHQFDSLHVALAVILYVVLGFFEPCRQDSRQVANLELDSGLPLEVFYAVAAVKAVKEDAPQVDGILLLPQEAVRLSWYIGRGLLGHISPSSSMLKKVRISSRKRCISLVLDSASRPPGESSEPAPQAA